MTSNAKRSFRFLAIGVYGLLLSLLVTEVLRQSLLRFSLVQASSEPQSPETLSRFMNLSLRLPNFFIITILLAIVLFFIAFRKPRRLWPISILALLIFVGLNLYSGRHIMLQFLIWPTPVTLSEQFVQAVAANDLEAAMQLTDRSTTCETGTTAAFAEHRSQLNQRLGDGAEGGIQKVSVRGISTHYDDPIPEDAGLLLPIPTNQAMIMVELENGDTVWFTLDMSYKPFLGRRYICGKP